MKDVLLIDDDNDEYFIFSEAIRHFREPLHCIYARSPEEAFLMLGHIRPAVILVDMNMPKMNGIECIERLQGMESGGARLLIYSTHMDDALCRTAKKAGATACLKKTSSIPQLVEQLSPYLSMP